MITFTLMTAKSTTTTALILAAFALVGGAVIPTGVALSTTPVAAYAQLPGLGDIVDNTLERAGITEEEDEEGVEDSNTDQQIEQPNDQQAGQQLDQSEESNRNNDNVQTQTGVEDQDSAQGIVDGDDLAAESISKSGDAKKYSTSSSTSGDAINENPQDAANDGVLNQDEAQTVDQQGSTLFGDDTADLDDINVAIPTAIPIAIEEQLDNEVLPPVDGEEDTFTVCVLPFGGFPTEQEVTLAELAQLTNDPNIEFVELGSCIL
jgi:hypothetical protein